MTTPHTEHPDGPGAASLPRAVPEARRTISFAWIVPILALGLAAVLTWQSLAERGPMISITFKRADGLQPGDPLVYRGMKIGQVRSISLTPTLDAILARVELRPDAAPLAVEGTRFWIVRPELSLQSVEGLETLFGPHYIVAEPPPTSHASAHDSPDGAAEPGPESAVGPSAPGKPRRAFIGLDERPRTAPLDPASLVITLQSTRAHAIEAGSPLLYRDVRVGTVLDTRLTPDARAVSIDVAVDPEYAPLVRANSRFFKTGGIGVDFGWIAGLTLHAESLQSIMRAGIAFATPTKPGEQAVNGDLFILEAESKSEWLDWTPEIPLPALAPAQ